MIERVQRTETVRFVDSTAKNLETNKMEREPRRHMDRFMVEIMIVVVLLGLLVAMALPAYQKIKQVEKDRQQYHRTH